MAGLSERGAQVSRRKPATQTDWGRTHLLESKCNHDRRLMAVIGRSPKTSGFRCRRPASPPGALRVCALSIVRASCGYNLPNRISANQSAWMDRRADHAPDACASTSRHPGRTAWRCARLAFFAPISTRACDSLPRRRTSSAGSMA